MDLFQTIIAIKSSSLSGISSLDSQSKMALAFFEALFPALLSNGLALKF